MFQTRLKQALEKVKLPEPITGVSKHWNNGLYREIIETDWWTWRKLTEVRMFQLFRNVSKQNWNKLWKKVKIPGPISGVSNHWNSELYREIIEMIWNMKKIDLSPNVSVVSKQNWNKLWIRWKYQAPYLVFRNTETMDYIGKLLKRTVTWRTLAQSECFSCFETFQNKIETRYGKGENIRLHIMEILCVKLTSSNLHLYSESKVWWGKEKKSDCGFQ